MSDRSDIARVCVGAVAGAQGVRGAVRIKSFTADPLDVGAYGPIEDEAGKRTWQIDVVGEAKGVVIAQLSGVKDRNAAEALRGTRLYVPRDVLPEPEEEEYYYADLIGLRVEDRDGQVIGRIRSVDDFGAGDVIEIARPGDRPLLLPFTRAVVLLVDLAGERLVVEPPIEVEAPSGGKEEAGEESGA